MAATLIGKFQAQLDGEFRNRVLVALVAAAVNTVGEAIDTTEGAEKRTAFARSVLADPVAHIDHVAIAVVEDGTDNGSTDTAITTRVGDLWDAFSGVRSGEG